MPSTSLQERIRAFENLGATQPRQNLTYHASDSPSIHGEPISSPEDSFSTIVPFISPQPISGSPSPSPPNLGRRSSLIDLKDWVVDDGTLAQPLRQDGRHTNGRQVTSNGSVRKTKAWNGRISSNSPTPLINLESPPAIKSVKVPPLPPRKPSYASIKTANNNGLRPPARSDSLSVEQHTYPPLTEGSRKGPGHVPASSISSFHSVSLSSDGGGEFPGDQTHIATFPMDRENSGENGDTNSLDESFENVSSTCAVSPTTASALAFDWGEAMKRAKQMGPPTLPQRPSSKSSLSVLPPVASLPHSVPTSPKAIIRSISSSSSSTATKSRRAPPPPPSISHLPPSMHFTPRSSRTSLASTSASDRSSILSNATTTSRTSTSTRASTQTTNKLSRPTPVPPAAQKRYEAVFVGNIIQRRKVERAAAKKKAAFLPATATKKSRAAAGWRGLSVDLITNPDDHPLLSGKAKDEGEDKVNIVGPEERVDAHSVKLIWCTSKLEKGKLKAIWNECDPTGRGSLDRDAFVKGMWRIDEELRRAQVTQKTTRIRPPPPIKHSNPRIILR